MLRKAVPFDHSMDCWLGFPTLHNKFFDPREMISALLSNECGL